MNANHYIAKALYNYLASNTQSNKPSRSFFRISGFDTDVCQQLLKIFRSDENILAGRSLWVRTIIPIPGYDEYTLEANRSATWYRNHIPVGYALVLIFNSRTSDEQSLKDIYRVTEGLLAIEEQSYLIDATFVDYQLSAEQVNVIKKFLGQLKQKLFQPQLRDLVQFLLSLNTSLHKNPTMTIETAIAQSLPQFGLFCCTELANKLGTSKGSRLLLDIFRASQLGTQILDAHQLNTYLTRLKNTPLEDDYNGKSAEQKRILISHFLTEILTDPEELLQILSIDWSEVTGIFFEKTRKTKSEQLQDLAETLQDALETQHFTKESLPEVIECTLEDLKGGRDPKEEDLDDLLAQFGGILPGALKNRLRRLRGVKKVQGTDFIANVLLMAIELVSPIQDEISEAIVLTVDFDTQHFDELDKNKDKDKIEALLAFRTLYGGIENVIPSVKWNIGKLWEMARQCEDLFEEANQEREGEQEKIIKAELNFRMTASVKDIVSFADLVWLYKSDGPTATTLAHVRAEAKRLSDNEKLLSIPIYNTCPITNDINNLDLSRPIVCFGAWYREFTNLHDELYNSLAHIMELASWNAFKQGLDQLEEAWGSFIRKSATMGILAAGLYELLVEYERLLDIATSLLKSRQEATYGYRVLTQAWMAGPKCFEEWAFVPFLHPLKLHWWYERCRYFNTLIATLIDPMVESPIVDERRFRQEVYSSYSSAGYPAILALPGRDLQPHYFLSVHEVEGYELFRRMEDASLAYGLDPNLVSEDEGSQAAKIAASELAHVVNDYLETYPYVYDGLQIYVMQCRNGALPGLLIEKLKELTHHHKKLRLNLVIHSVDRGAPLYQNVIEWLKTHEEFTERTVDNYFPQVTLTVLQCSYEELFQRVRDTDIVILPDVLAENGQVVKAKAVTSQQTTLDGYFPLYNVQRAPFERQELIRDILLNPLSQPLLLQRFYGMQWAAQEREIMPVNETMSFTLQVSLQLWEKMLAELHKHFRWVICYDTTVDRFLLEATLKSSVQVIRYSLGLGVKKRHNLTVSSSYKAQDVVERRLTTNLETLLPSTDYDFRKQIAQNLIAQAKQVSGDIVLRAAGPGAYLNELIGMVAAKHLTEQRYLQKHPGALCTWIYLDDFSHWFERKLPDLLFIAIPVNINGKVPLHIEVIETKCISETYFTSESLDAQRQVAQGVNRLGQAWSPGSTHLDAQYWYDQLYQAVVGNLSVHRDQMHLWEAFRHCLPKGDFILEMSGHTWIFCYDRVSGVFNQIQEGIINKALSDTQHIPQYYHHYSRSDLRIVLRKLVEDWQILAPPNVWKNENTIADDDSMIKATDLKSIRTSTTIPTGGNILVQQKLFHEPESSESKRVDDTNLSGGPTEDTSIQGQNQAIGISSNSDANWIRDKARKLEYALHHYGIRIHPIDPAIADIGPSIIRFKLRLRPGEQINKIQRIASDLARELSLNTTPLIANIPSTIYVGIDLPRQKSQTVYLQPLLNQLSHSILGELPIIIGQTPDGKTIIEDLSEFPHLLVAGATNSGKSVFLRSLILCLLNQYTPKDLRLIIVDPKRTDFSFFNGLPYLNGDRVIIDENEARDALLNLVQSEMPRRQKILEDRSTRLKDFNQRFPKEALPPIVAIIDEYAQLLNSINKKQEREEFKQDLMSLAAVARATGIHLVLATQRPSADIVTGTLKANLPVSIAFKVASAVNSRIVIDQGGAENLLGRGDMLFRQSDGELSRLQAPFIDEVSIQNYLKQLRTKLS